MKAGNESLSTVKTNEILFKKFRFALMALGSITFLVASVFYILDENYTPVGLFGSLVIFAYIVLYSEKLNLRVRMFGLCLVEFMIGLVHLFTTSLYGPACLWFVLSSVLAGTLLGAKSGYAAIALSLVTVSVHLLLTNMTGNTLIIESPFPPGAGLEYIFNLLFVAYMITIPFTFLINKLDKAFLLERKQSSELNSLNNKLHEKNQELESFSYSVSHDLKAPVRHIAGYLEHVKTLNENKLDENTLILLDKVDKISSRMGELIEDILRLSKMSQMEISPEEVDLSHIATSHLGHLQDTEPDRNVRIVVEHGISTLGDAHLLSIAMENLVNNAWKYSKYKDDAIIEFGCFSDNGVPVYFLKDNGAGFSSEYKDKLFTPFERLHSASKFDGSGIGLATVKKIIDKHSGKIWAESAPDQGATFFFTIASEETSGN